MLAPSPSAAVVIGDAGDDLSYRNLDIAFRQLRAGAAFVAMHRNPWWMTPKGVTLDAGAYVLGLEAALGRRAVICGKPSPVVFRQAVAELRAELASRAGGSAESRLRAGDVAMVGDDPSADIAALEAGRPARDPRAQRQGRRRGAPRPAASARRPSRANLGEVIRALPAG